MKQTLVILIGLCIGTIGIAQERQAPVPNYDLAARFSPAHMNKMVYSTQLIPHWLKESNRFWYTYVTSAGRQYYIVDPARGTKALLFDPVKMAADMSRLTGDPFDAQHMNILKLKFIKNETVLQFEVTSKLVEEAEEEEEGDGQEEKKQKSGKPKMKAKVWHFEYDLTTKTLQLLDEFEEPDDDPNWANISPDRSYVLYSKGHNLYWMDMENYEKVLEDDKDSTIVENQWTEDGVEHFAYGGRGRGVDNVEKEKNKDKRQPVYVTWSPDSKKFALVRSDMRKVKDLWVLNNTAKPRPTLETYKYHMPGEKDAPYYEMAVFDWETKEKIIVQADTFKDQTVSVLRAPRMVKNRDDDFQPSLWLAGTSDRLYFTRTSRDLKRIDFCVADTETGMVEVLVEERLNTYVETRTPRLLDDGKQFIWWSERDGWGHWYLYNSDGSMVRQITSGAYHCERIEGMDEERGLLYFVANGREEEEDPYYTHLYRVKLDGTNMTLLNKGNYSHTTSMNDEATFFVNTYSRVNTTPTSSLHDANGRKVLDLEVADLSKLQETGYQFPQPYTVKAADGITDLYGVMYKPFDFDSTKSYPIIAYVYPGPQTEAVGKSFSARMDRTDRLAQMGFIVITIGNRGGHPSRSKWYHNYGYGNLRDYGLEDKKVAIEQLADRHDFIDMDKVGIFGHSGGGFMSTAAMLVYPDFFKVAVSSAGNHENNIYNRWWSEKHHGVKEVTDADGNISFEYDIEKNSELAKNLKGKLLICTGDIDNNVHPANTIRMAEALIKANKRFDFFIFPGQRHGFGSMNEYFFWLRADYFAEHLLGDSRSSTDMLYMNMGKAMNR